MSKKTYETQALRAKEPSRRCVALDDMGRQCRWQAVVRESFHGNPETRDFNRDDPAWVLVYFCTKHKS